MEECLDGHTESGCDLLPSTISCVGLNLKVLRGVTRLLMKASVLLLSFSNLMLMKLS